MSCLREGFAAVLGEGGTCGRGARAQVGWIKAGVFSLSVCLPGLPALAAAAFAPGPCRQQKCGAMAVMVSGLSLGTREMARWSMAEGVSPGTGAEPPSREQGAFPGQADPDPQSRCLCPGPRCEQLQPALISIIAGRAGLCPQFSAETRECDGEIRGERREVKV